MKNTIFVSIASYRDAECLPTLRDLFEKAQHPERIHVAVLGQYHLTEDRHMFEGEYPYKNNVTFELIDQTLSKGACWARAKIQQKYQGEAYALQIDSHTRFVQNWDEKAIGWIKKLQSKGFEKPLLTHYAPTYELDGRYNDCLIKLGPQDFAENDILRFQVSEGIHHKDAPALPWPGAFMSGHFLFGPGTYITEVPYDPTLYFIGEEISLSVRLWTQGYDIFYPNETIVFSLYSRTQLDKEKKVTSRVMHQGDNKNSLTLDQYSKQRVRHMLGTEISSDTDVLKGLNQYGLGTQRSLEEYERFSGVDFRHKHFALFTKMVMFTSERTPYQGTPQFSNTPIVSEQAQSALNILFKKLSIHSVLDIGNLLSHSAPFSNHYQWIGTHAPALNPPPALSLSEEWLHHLLPKTDALFLPSLFKDSMATWNCLHLLKYSATQYLIAPISLCESPFFIEKPLLKCAEHGLWKIKDSKLYFDPVSPEQALLRKELLNAFDNDYQALCFDMPDKVMRTTFLSNFKESWEKTNERWHLSDFFKDQRLNLVLSQIYGDFFRVCNRSELHLLSKPYQLITENHNISQFAKWAFLEWLETKLTL